MPKRVTLSVVMPNYNDAPYLARAIESILGQSRPPDEFLILDDASTDNSVEIIESYARRSPLIRLTRLDKNVGVNEANRQLCEMASGDWIHPLAADDARTPNSCELAMQMAEAHPSAGIVMGKMAVMSPEGAREGTIEIKNWTAPLYASPGRFLQEYLLTEAPSHSLVGSTFFRREPFREVGWYCTELESWGDTFAARAIALKYGACYVPEDFCIWYRFPDSYSQRLLSRPEQTLDIINRAAALMRSAPFRDRFPAEFVRQWRRRYAWRTIKEFWRGDLAAELPPGTPYWKKCRLRLLRTLPALALLVYRDHS